MGNHENRLSQERSPYLLQHAKNPVDWYPWGAEALERAKREDKPILLSIGYAACHWCHVMERESFENEAIAQRMNELYINIKVDREERPDLDHIYQLVVQLMRRNGGWPLTVFLTPDKLPFFAGTYFPPESRPGMTGFPDILEAVANAYRKRRGEVLAQASEIVEEIGNIDKLPKGSGHLPPEMLRKACRRLLARFDSQNGGFGARPKFPSTMSLDVMLLRGALEGDAVSRESVELTLDKMQKGGIWDHLRGGFHRYSTDARWLVPHFEKMLYDNALLLRLYVDGYRVFGHERFAKTATEIVEWLFAEMLDADGGFYATQDADSEGEEGKFFVWKLDDVRKAAPNDVEGYDVARVFFGITEEGNFEQSGATVLSETRSIEHTAAILDLEVDAAKKALERIRTRMLTLREARPKPTRDDKMLTSWNALMIAALVDAGRALRKPSWIEAAERAFVMLQERVVVDGRARRYVMPGETEAPTTRRGFLDDQAYLANAAIELYEATTNPSYMALATEITLEMLKHHEDEKEGGFFFAADDGEALIARTKDVFDQAVPSGASMAALVCLRLGEMVDERFTIPARKQLDAVAPTAIDNPLGLGKTIVALDRLARGSVDIVIVGDPQSETAQAMADVVFARYLPHRNVAWINTAKPESASVVKVLAEGKAAVPGQTAAYVCRNRTCSAPVATASELAALLDQG